MSPKFQKRSALKFADELSRKAEDNATQALMKLRYYKRSTVISASCNEAKTSEA